MSPNNSSIPDTLDRHLSANSHHDLPGVAAYVERGAALVTPAAIASLQKLLKPLHKKIDSLQDCKGLGSRLKLLSTYFEEACADGSRGTLAHREITFALLYFLKGFDRIPDSVPEVGLQDDDMIVQVALEHHSDTLREHWRRRNRSWPQAL